MVGWSGGRSPIDQILDPDVSQGIGQGCLLLSGSALLHCIEGDGKISQDNDNDGSLSLAADGLWAVSRQAGLSQPGKKSNAGGRQT